MKVDEQELAVRFAALSDEELQERISTGTLTSVAEEVARAELAARGLSGSFAAAQEMAETEPDAPPPPPEGIGLVTLLRTNDVLKANVLRMHLESEGIFAYLWGEHLGVAHLVFSAATGGMGLQVRSDQLQRARAVLTAFEKGEYALDEGEEQPE